jgi:alpha-tubulin suppressor-like RCC1 family protein
MRPNPPSPNPLAVALLLAALLLVASPNVVLSWERQGDSARKNLKGKELFKTGLKLEATQVWEEAFLDSCGGEELGIANNLGIVHYQLAQKQAAFYFFHYALTLDSMGAFRLKNRAKVEAAATDLETTLSKDFTRLEIRTSPVPNARVCFASQQLGGCYKTPFVWYAAEGLHLFTLAREGGEEKTVEVTLVRGKPQTLTVDLPGLETSDEFSRTIVGKGHSCGLDGAGRLSCWGDNRFAQLGGGTCEWSRPEPLPVRELPPGITEVAVGGKTSCALTGDGLAWCWGDNTSGQVGNGSGGGGEDVVPTATPVAGIPAEVIGIAVGESHACALLRDGSVRCWGDNRRGQLGVGLPVGTLAMTAVPMAIPGLTAPATRLAAGSAHTCALLQGDTVMCWGANESGQLGNGTRIPSPGAVPATELGSDVKELTCMPEGTCAIQPGNIRKCVGEVPR